MLHIGLTGGIASGKSTVARLFGELGAPVIDADQLSRDVVKPGTPGLQGIRQIFGESVISADGSLDRAALRRIVFDEPAKRVELEQLLHPLIRAASDALADTYRARGTAYAVFEIPLLLESERYKDVDRVVVVDVPEETQIQRVMARDQSSEAQAKKILAAQSSRAARLAIADDVIDNTGSLASLKTAVSTLHQRYLQEAKLAD